ncbi:MAG: hypothetical protein QG657_843 [Acidobacteriota bacterium]|nr:hypothetical protein [Acidobacteriota bacterium]
MPKADAEDKGKVWINEQQYFDNVPQIAWEFFIGSYQPAQRRKNGSKTGKTGIIVALSETHRLMKAIDEIEIEN